MSEPSATANMTAVQLDALYGGGGDPVSAFLVGGVLGATYNDTLRYSVIGLALQGIASMITLMMARRYFRTFPEDPLWIRALVGCMCVGNVGSMMFSYIETAMLWEQRYEMHYHIYGELVRLHLVYSMIQINQTGVQVFFTHRCWLLWDRSKIVLIVGIVLNGADFLYDLLTTILSLTMLPNEKWGTLTPADIPRVLPDLEHYGAEMQTMFKVLQSLNNGCEIGLTIMIMIALIRRKTGWSQTDGVLEKLIRFSMESMLPPSLNNIVNMVLFLAGYGSGSGTKVLGMVVPSLYLHAVVYSLNARSAVRLHINGNTAMTRGKDHGKSSAFGQSKVASMRHQSQGGTRGFSGRNADQDQMNDTLVQIEHTNSPDIDMTHNNSTKNLIDGSQGVIITTEQEIYADSQNADDFRDGPHSANRSMPLV